MVVMVCLGVRYLNATHLATDLRWPFSPSARRKPACRLLRSCPGLLYRIQDVSMPFASGEIASPPATPWWKNAQLIFSSGNMFLSTLTELLTGLTIHVKLNVGIWYFCVSNG